MDLERDAIFTKKKIESMPIILIYRHLDRLESHPLKRGG